MAHANTSSSFPDPELANGPLTGLKVLDLSRILAGPFCTQFLGDLGAEVYKIERPQKGDDTRFWGPPFVKDGKGENTTESAYYLCANRNKYSVAVDIASPEGQDIVRRLALECDVLIENFKAGDLARRGLDYETLAIKNPGLIYCSITGFGMTGPYANRPGYDFLIQGMGGIMSLTGKPDEQGGEPTKCGVGIADVMCGMYAANAIQAALHARNATGKGQHIDLSLLDTQVAWLINQGSAHLVSGDVPVRRGNEHPTIVPYSTFPACDGTFIIACGNDTQFSNLVHVLGAPELADDERFKTNVARVENRQFVIETLEKLTKANTVTHWISALEAANVPCGPVNDLRQVFEDPQIRHRGMRISLPHEQAANGSVDMIANPVNFSQTPVTYRHAPPVRGQHTDEILRDVLGMDTSEIESVRKTGAVE